MRLVLTLAFLAAASLRGAELGLPVSTTAAPAQAGPLTLEKAIDRALLHNLGLTVTRLDALRSLDAVEVSESVFDPTFAWTNRSVIREIDINPVFVGTPGQGCFIADALIVPA